MSPWLKPRLTALFFGATVLGGATYLHAQGSVPPPAKSPEEAALQFYKLLSAIDTTNGNPSQMMRSDVYLNTGIISREQSKWLSNQYRTREMFQDLIVAMHAPQYDSHVTSTEGNQTFVEVTPSASPQPREIVVVPEDGGYRVDLKATYGKWSDLSGAQLDDAWYRYTGEISPTLRQQPNFLRAQCQSNLKQQMLGALQYMQDYDEKLPPAREWIDVLQPYTRSEQIFKCPALDKPGNGYAYNQYMSRANFASLQSPATTVGIYETSNLGRNVFGTGTGRAYRHEDGWNLGFMDGHVKYFTRQRMSEPSNLIHFKP